MESREKLTKGCERFDGWMWRALLRFRGAAGGWVAAITAAAVIFAVSDLTSSATCKVAEVSDPRACGRTLMTHDAWFATVITVLAFSAPAVKAVGERLGAIVRAKLGNPNPEGFTPEA
jgi:hypothetical protein